MTHDPIVDEVRQVREELARAFNFDVHAICCDLMNRQGATVSLEELRARKRARQQQESAVSSSREK